jgi:Fic family protein
MERLLDWTNQATAQRWLHPLLIVSAFTVRFLAVHPFQDGNGRLSRILTTLLLLRSGYAYVPFASLEGIIEQNKDRYYSALRATQSTLKDRTPTWHPWTTFFLQSLGRHKDVLLTKLERERLLEESLSPLSSAILSLLQQHGQLSISELERLTGSNKNTLKVRLRELVRSGMISAVGRARATRYKPGPAKLS